MLEMAADYSKRARAARKDQGLPATVIDPNVLARVRLALEPRPQ